MAQRDYSLLGPDGHRAVESGLAETEWYRSDVSRRQMKDLMKRSDQPALRDTFVLFGAMSVLAGVGIALWPSWWSAPFWLAYGVLYGSAMDSRWHECGHGTAFRTGWIERRRLSHREFLHDPQSRDVALEPRAPPHRHDHRRARP